MIIANDLLENTCKNMIETILTCLEHATKGTIYRVGPMPKLQTVRVTSGIRKAGSDEISWGLPTLSDYNFPGKCWEQYKDRPGQLLEAMGWCVEKQRSWTADNPHDDIRSVNKQLRGEIEDSYHMEPVLVRKVDIHGESLDVIEYPTDWQGNPIWQDSEYVVAGVIKIHFPTGALSLGDRNTKVIKELSRSLGTELLSLHLRETLHQAQKELTRERLASCQVLAHELRNTLTKFSFVFSAVNAQIGILREEWELQLRKANPELEWKGPILARLSELVRAHLPEARGSESLLRLCQALLADQKELADYSLLPVSAEKWVSDRIQPKWEMLFRDCQLWEPDREEARRLLRSLRTVLRMGMDEDLARRVTTLPEDLKSTWRRLCYTSLSTENIPILGEIIDLLEHPDLSLTHKHQMRKVFKSLKALVEILPEVEDRANHIILALRCGIHWNMEGLDISAGVGTAAGGFTPDACGLVLNQANQ